MSSMMNESGGRKMANSRKDSPPVDESCSDKRGGTLKKGPWTPAEDAILMDYVNKHGEGNWNAVQKHSGLSRCGKSCRLRWANHLRPDLKKGAFSPEEESLIIELHAKIGNKWARMSAELPGRTDNEIKNFWNTRTKRLQRAGLPIYPPDVCLHVLNGNQEGPHMDTLEAGDTHHSDLLEEDSLEIPDVEFKNLELDRGIYSLPPQLLDIPASSILRPGVSSSQNVTFMLPTMLPPKRSRESETLLPYVDGNSICNAYLFGSSSPFDPDFIYSHQFPFDGVLGRHTLLNGNSSSSEPASEAMMKSELPSLQYSETQQGSWDLPASPLPSLESVDTLIQSPPTKESTQPDYLLPHCTGLLEAVLYESQALKRPKKSSGQQTSDNAAMPSDAVHSISAEGKEWEKYGDPNSHSSYSVVSEFSAHTPINQCSSGESQMAETMSGYDVKPEEACQVTAQNVDEKELPKMDFSRLDVLLDSSWLHGSKHSKDQWILSDAIDALLCEDYISDHP